MGAFGELLIQHLGGDLERYRGNKRIYTAPKPKSEAQIKKELIEADKRLLSKIQYHSNEIREQLSNHIKRLQTEGLECKKYFKTEEQQIKFVEWRKTFLEETLKVFNNNNH